MTKFIALPLIVIVLLCSESLVFALPSLDPEHQFVATTEDSSYQMIRDKFNKDSWYYISPRLRIPTRSVDGKQIPKMSVLRFESGGSYHAIVTVTVTAAASEAHLSFMRDKVANWMNQSRERRDSDELVHADALSNPSPIGPISDSRLRLIMYNFNSGNPELISITPVLDPTLHGEIRNEISKLDETIPNGQINKYDATQIQANIQWIPGAPYLTQDNNINFTLSGLGVDVFLGFLTRTIEGGIIILQQGTYEAESVDAKIDIKLDRSMAREYFHEKKERETNWDLLFWSGNSHEVEETIRQSQNFNGSLVITGRQTGEFTSAEFQAISDSLFNFVNQEIFKFTGLGESVPNTTMPSTKLANASLDVGKVLGMSSLDGLKVSFNQSSVTGKIEVNETASGTAEAKYRRSFVKDAPFLVSGVLGAGLLDDVDLSHVIVTIEQESPYFIHLVTPDYTDLTSLTYKAMLATRLDFVRPQTHHNGHYQASFDLNANGQWYSPIGTQQDLIVNGNVIARAATPEGASGAYASLHIPILNSHLASSEGSIRIRPEFEADGIRADVNKSLTDINLANLVDTRVLSVSPSRDLDFELLKIDSLQVALGTSGSKYFEDRKLSEHAITLPEWKNAATATPVSLLFPGHLDAVVVTTTYLDALAGDVTRPFYIDKRIVEQLNTITTSLHISPANIGLYHLTLSFESIGLLGGKQPIKAILYGEAEGGESRSSEKAIPTDGSPLSLLTYFKPNKLELRTTDGKWQVNEAVIKQLQLDHRLSSLLASDFTKVE